MSADSEVIVHNEEVREKYVREFQPRGYPEVIRAYLDLVLFYQRELHSIFNSPVSDSWRTLLDIGCGPTVANVFPASAKIDSIVLSDLVPGNRQEVEKWIQKAPDAIDWSFMSERLAILEGCRDAKSGAKDIEERTRMAIKKVIPCDVLNPSVLPEGHVGTFDVVFTSLCLEAASGDENTYQDVTRNVSRLVRGGGHLILNGVAGSWQYIVDGVTFPDLRLTKAMVENSLSRSGLEITRWRSLDNPVVSGPEKDWDFIFTVLAQKV